MSDIKTQDKTKVCTSVILLELTTPLKNDLPCIRDDLLFTPASVL